MRQAKNESCEFTVPRISPDKKRMFLQLVSQLVAKRWIRDQEEAELRKAAPMKSGPESSSDLGIPPE